MLTPVPDHILKETVEALRAHRGNQTQAAAMLGIPRTTLQSRLRLAMRRGLLIPDLEIKKQSVLHDGHGNVNAQWDKLAQVGLIDSPDLHLPDPKTVTKISTLYGPDGKIQQRWVAEKPTDIQREDAWRALADELKTSLPRYPPVPMPSDADSETLSCYPVGDHHLGMLAWKEETGTSYDLEIGEKLLAKATQFLMRCTPNSKYALIAFLGDFMHYDSFVPVTPTSRNQLDSDGRFPKMVRTAIRCMRHMIDSALRKHQSVHVIVEIGNHDLASSIFLMECLAIAYENEPRVTIDTSPRHYHYYQFGKVLIGTHHGHGSKMEQLPIIMATDVPEWWGQSKHRMIWTGHMHHSKKLDFQSQNDIAGVSVEQFRVLPPNDAYAAQKGYRSIRDMKAIVVHKDHGEVARVTFNPEMLRG